jgi:hypothetical protein
MAFLAEFKANIKLDLNLRFYGYQHNPDLFFSQILSVVLCDSTRLHQPTWLVITFIGAYWFLSDEATLIEFLVICKSVVEDGFNFKAVTWTAAAAHMAAYTKKGDPKNTSVCNCYNASRRTLESQRTKGTAEEEIRLYYV